MRERAYFPFRPHPVNAAPDQSSRSSTFVANDSRLLAKVMALLKQSCCVAGRFSTNHLWLSPRCIPHVSIYITITARMSSNQQTLTAQVIYVMASWSRASN